MVLSPQATRNDIKAVELDLAVGDAAFVFTNARRDELFYDRGHFSADGAVGRGPEGHERPAGAGGEGEVGGEFGFVAHAEGWLLVRKRRCGVGDGMNGRGVDSVLRRVVLSAG